MLVRQARHETTIDMMIIIPLHSLYWRQFKQQDDILLLSLLIHLGWGLNGNGKGHVKLKASNSHYYIEALKN